MQKLIDVKSNPTCGLDSAVRILLLVYVALVPPIAHTQVKVCSFVRKDAVTTAPVVLILRPHVQIWKDRGLSLSESGGATDAAGAGFQGVLARMFEDEGHKLLLDPMVQKEWEETPPNDYAVTALNDHFNSHVLPIAGSQDCRTLSKISFKGDLERLKDHDGFDAVVVSRASGTLPTKLGKVVGAVNPYGSDALSFNIGVVDRVSGALLYYCSSSVASGDYVDEPDARLSGPIRKCLDQYFNAKPRRRWIRFLIF